MRDEARRLLAEFDLDIDVDRPLDRLPVSTRQIVEIAKALSLKSHILLLDEPTSSLAPDEVQALFVLIRQLTRRGIGIVYVSHHMAEIFEIADRVTVLRDGRHVSTRASGETSENRIVEEMVGGALDATDEARTGQRSGPVLTARGLTRAGAFEDVDLTLHAGEIVAFAGLMGSRSGDIARALVGLERIDRGTLEIDGAAFRPGTLRDAMNVGIGYVPDERKTDGLFLDFSVRDNLAAATLKRHTRWGVLNKASTRSAATAAIDDFAIKTPGPDARVGALSGGNQQKVMLAKWLETRPRALIVNEPTKGVDVGAKQHIRRALRRCANDGMAVLVVSSDFPELLGLADRILVVQGGRIAGEVAGDEPTADELVALAAGAPTSATVQKRRRA